MSPKTGEEETAATDAVETMAMVEKDTPNVETKDPPLKGRKRFCKRRPTRCETCLLLVVIVLLIVGVVMTYLYVSSYLRTKDKTTESDKNQSGLCNTASCVFTASDLLVGVDPKVDPCKDFYAYACGRWHVHNPIPKGKESWNQFDKLTKSTNDYIRELIESKEIRARYSKDTAVIKLLTFYDSCVDEAAIEERDAAPLKELIEKYGSWPMGNQAWNKSGWDLVKSLATIGRDLGFYSLINPRVRADAKNNTQNVIMLFKTWPFSISRSQLLSNDTRARKVKSVWKELIRNITVALGGINVTDSDIEDIIKLEEKLATFIKPLNRRTMYKDYQKITVRELNKYTGYKFDWLIYFQILFAKTNFAITEDQEIVVLNLDELQNVTQLLNVTSKRTAANFVMWRVVKYKYWLLSKRFLGFQKSYYLQLYNRWSEMKKEELCMFQIKEQGFGMPLARVYVDQKFSEDKKKQAKKIMDDVRAAFVENLDNLGWMDESSKNLAKAKAEGVVEHIGYPDYLTDREKLNKEYEEVVSLPKRYFENEVSFLKNKNLKMLKNMGKPVDPNEWTYVPNKVNAVYFDNLNKILFPAAILQPPFYSKDYLSAVNYGSIGTIMAHELLHGFDDTGKNFDVLGNRAKWWSDKTTAEFNNRTHCFIDQMSNFTFYGHKLNGQRTLSENLADNGGLKYSFLAYKTWVKRNGEESRLPGMKLTNEQVFFISFAKNWCSVFTPKGATRGISWSSHSPLPWRTNGTLRNFPQFAEAFNCPVGSPMNPEKKCQMW